MSRWEADCRKWAPFAIPERSEITLFLESLSFIRVNHRSMIDLRVSMMDDIP
ncbi:MAG: hypothetical protein WCL32_15410 [Planctomycetota bacterium]